MAQTSKELVFVVCKRNVLGLGFMRRLSYTSRFDGIRGKWIETDWKLESALAYLVGFVGPDEKFNCEAQVGN